MSTATTKGERGQRAYNSSIGEPGSASYTHGARACVHVHTPTPACMLEDSKRMSEETTACHSPEQDTG